MRWQPTVLHSLVGPVCCLFALLSAGCHDDSGTSRVDAPATLPVAAMRQPDSASGDAANEREMLLQQQLELERAKAELERTGLEQQLALERQAAKLEREKREQLDRDARTKVAAEDAARRERTFSAAEFAGIKTVVESGSNAIGEMLLAGTHPTGTYGDCRSPLVTLSADGERICGRFTVNWKGGFSKSLYVTVYAVTLPKRGSLRLEVVSDNALIKIDPQFLKMAEHTLREALAGNAP